MKRLTYLRKGTEQQDRVSWFSKLRGLVAPSTPEKNFDLELYLTTRKRSPVELRFHETVQKASRGVLTVEDVQRMANKMHSKVEVMRLLLAQLDLRSQKETDRFTQHFTKLWDNTPRVDLGGATPAAAQQKGVGDEPARAVGRNDPCPCGSGRKFKRCCG